MAIGDIKQFGYWKAANKSNQDYYYYGTTNYLTRSIDYSYYNSLKIVDQNIDNESPLKWVEARVNNRRVYISVDTVSNYISYNEAKDYCNNNTVEINNSKYAFAIMSREEWTGTGTSIANKTYLGDQLIITNTIIDG